MLGGKTAGRAWCEKEQGERGQMEGREKEGKRWGKERKGEGERENIYLKSVFH